MRLSDVISALYALGLGSALLSQHPALAADCNMNGVDDGEEIAMGQSQDCNGNGIPDGCELVPPSFDRHSFAVLGRPRALVLGDFNNDGRLDCATGNDPSGPSNDAHVSVFLNQGDGEFDRSDQQGGTRIAALAAGDTDGDGDLDLVAVDSDTIRVLLNNGDGRFEAPLNIATTPGISDLDIGDVDGNGSADIVVTNRRKPYRVSLFVNDGNGRFAGAVDVTVGDDPRAVSLEDVEGDGDLDIITANSASGDISVLLNAGDGTFAEERIAVGGNRPETVVTADLNGDNRLDLAVATRSGVVVLLNNGRGSFQQGRPMALASTVNALVSGDFDEDGDLDLVARSFQSPDVALLVNEGDGSFDARVDLGLNTVPNALASGDLDGDGRFDLAGTVIAEGKVFFFLKTGFSTVEVLSLQARSFPMNSQPHNAVLLDVDGDGDLDVATSNGHENTVALGINDGKGVLSVREVRPARSATSLQSITAADLDQDGDFDVIVGGNDTHEAIVLLNDGSGNFDDGTPYSVGKNPLTMTHADLNDDGFEDVITTNSASNDVSILLNDRNGGLEPHRPVAVRGGPRGGDPADLDGDGDIDLAVANSGSDEISVLLNQGDGVSFSHSFFDATDPSDVVPADLDNDGDLDLAASSRSRSSVSVFKNNGDGNFEFFNTTPIGEAPNSVIAVDLNQDGSMDLVTGNPTSHTLSILINQGDATFKPPITVSTGRGPRYVLTADMDGDGDPEVISADHGGDSITIHFNEGTDASNIPFLEKICTQPDFYTVSVHSAQEDGVRLTKYIVPKDPADPSLLTPKVQNVRRFPLHEEFLAAVFPDLFPALTPDLYNQLVNRRASRKYFVGNLYLLRTDSGPLYGFSILADFLSDRAELPRIEEVRGVYETMSDVITLRPLAYYPDTPPAFEDARDWGDPGFPVHLKDPTTTIEFQAYTQGVGYGRVRLLREVEFQQANATGRISFQDVLVLERAPRDIEGVPGGVITAEEQGLLSHVAIRTNRRGTPNAFVKDALEELAHVEGKLVRLEVKESGYTVEPATQEDAERFWQSNRPSLSVQPTVDPTWTEFSSLAEIAAQDGGDVSIESRFGGKAAGLARLQTILVGPWEKYRLKGFGIPVHYYLEFVQSNRMPSAVDPRRQVSYKEYLEELFENDEFQSNSVFRFGALAALRTQMRDRSWIDPELVERLAARIGEVYAHLPREHRVRFRSSSNMEDAIEFNGAGLYDSTSVCVADILDGDDVGPSRCDPTRRTERGTARGLRRVWASLWNFRAYEERAFYGIDQRLAAMGILSNKAFIDERANGVALTGNPTNPLDSRYVVTVQRGDESVVSPQPGVLPEQDLLEMTADGQVARIIRAVASTLVPPGEFVLSDDELRELGALMWHIDHNYPLDPGDHAREDVLLDLEFKIEAEGSLAVKQVRPFLRSTPSVPRPTFELEIPAATEVCSIFVPFRSPLDTYRLKSTVRFAAGSLRLPTTSESFEAELFEEVRLGPERGIALPAAPGRFTVRRIPQPGDVTTYRFDYEQEFALAGGESYKLKLSSLRFQARGAEAVGPAKVLDEEFLTQNLSLQGTLDLVVTYSSCTYELLPLWEVEAEYDDGSSLRLLERHEPPPDLNQTGPASLIDARVNLRGTRREVSDFFRLVYTAGRHNLDVRYWVVFEPPVEVAGLEKPVRVLDVIAPELQFGTEGAARYLDGNFEEIASSKVTSYRRERARPLSGRPFRRGDVDVTGQVNITDALVLLNYLFRRGELPPCAKATDATDDGKVGIDDAIRILLHLFGQAGSLPAPFRSCGPDLTEDSLTCESYPLCR